MHTTVTGQIMNDEAHPSCLFVPTLASVTSLAALC